MKNRTWLPLSLDIAGLIALCFAIVSLGSALYFAATPLEAQLLHAFKYALAASVGAFLLARVCEITRLLQTSAEPAAVQAVAASNVESLPGRDSLPRAA